MSTLTIVTYHYVRDLAHSRYPGIKGLSIEAFEGQLDYLTKHYTVCSMRDVVDAARGRGTLPERACALTFDDGFVDHFSVVFPRLVARGLTASFYPPVAAVQQRGVLETHQIHLVLAVAGQDGAALARRVRQRIEAHRDAGSPSAAELYATHAAPSRFDDADVAFVKRVLQKGLSPRVRSAILRELYDEYVGVDLRVMARELYMDLAQLRCMVQHGMDVGGHGAEHVWLDTLSRAGQEDEVARTVALLGEVYRARPHDWVMCYPFGAHDATTLDVVGAAGCALGLTTRVGVARDLAQPLVLPRLDTNDLPRRGDAAPTALEAPRG
jgi:peptidoglycan/xylan/chitin deacetylase (PgdA/CDA1 family)